MDAVIVDVDGTLCDVSGVRHYVLADPRNRNFDAFHSASAVCPPIPTTLTWVDGQRVAGRAIIVVTARNRKWHYLTRTWMRKWGITCDAFYMRQDGDHRPDRQVKTDILADIRAAGYTVVGAIDDNPAVVALWEAEGIPTAVVPGWDVDISEYASN